MNPFLIQINEPEFFEREHCLFTGKLERLVIEKLCIHFDFEKTLSLNYYHFNSGDIRIEVIDGNGGHTSFHAKVFKGIIPVMRSIDNNNYNAFCFEADEGLAFLNYCLGLHAQDNNAVCQCGDTEERYGNEVIVYYDDYDDADTGLYITEIEDLHFSKACWEYLKNRNHHC